ncbi:MAG: transposase [Phycisphaerae bacterium]|nr:transposase [Phycisphaerae bacterium]
MNESEPKVAIELVSKLNDPGYLIGDRAYDSNKLYDICASRDVQLVTFQHRKNAQGFGHRRHSEYRMRAMHLKDTNFCLALLNSREQIERMFGRLTSFCCGLSLLPSWVRTLHRVEMWIMAKMIFYQIWRKELAPSAA